MEPNPQTSRLIADYIISSLSELVCLCSVSKMESPATPPYNNNNLSWEGFTSVLNGSTLWSTQFNSSVGGYSLDSSALVPFSEPAPSTPGSHVEDDLLLLAVSSLVLGVVILATIVGNVFVIVAIVKDRSLRRVGNFLVLSLAVADLMVAALVMPLGALYEVTQQWTLGAVLCEVWTAFDVLCCTASILHLVAIATDRFWAVTNVDYARNRSAKQIRIMILLVWGVAVAVSLAPIVGWKDSEFLQRVELEQRCLLSQDVGYQIFATLASFYVPLVVILLLYWRIWREASKRIRHRPGQRLASGLRKMSSRVRGKASPAELTVFIDHSCLPSPDRSSTNGTGLESCPDMPPSRNGEGPEGHLQVPKKVYPQPDVTPKKNKKRRETIEAKRERKAAKTLAIITGVFVVCWLPFFIMALTMAICHNCEPSPLVFSLLLWLGYVNSLLNPVIYTIFSPDFRAAFRKILGSKTVLLPVRTQP